MFCQNCGSQMRDDDRFCPNCGAVNSPDTGSGGFVQDAAPAWEMPTGGGKKKTGLVIGVAAAAVAAVAVISVVAVMASGLFASPKGQVEKAFFKSVAAYQAAGNKLGIPDIKQWQKDRTIHQEYSLELQDINSVLTGYDMSALKGLGLRADANYDGKARKMSMELGAYWGEDDLLSFRMAADGDELSFASPEFTDGGFYGVNTKTLGADLADMTGEDSIEDLSFNLFELVDLALDWADTEAMRQGLKDASVKLWEAAEVEKKGEKTLDINGASTKTTAYHITISDRNLERYVDDLEDVMSSMDYVEFYEELLRGMGMPRDAIEDILDELDDVDIYGELFDELRELIDDDLELDVCLSGGYLSAVLYETRIDGTNLELTVCLGGKKEYVDDISAVLEFTGGSIELTSSGDHGLKNGAYTDETTFRVRQGGSNLVRVNSELRFNPKGKSDNLQWELSAESSGQKAALDIEGSLAMDKDQLSMDLNQVSVRAMDMKLCTLALQYTVDRKPDPITAGKTERITDLSERELMEIGNDIERNAERWASDMQELFTSRLPAELLWAITRVF